MAKQAKKWKPRAGETELLDQVRVAAQQLDDAPGGRLGWVVWFAQQDPTRWLPADREAHGYRLLAFAMPAFAHPPYAPFLVGGTSIYPLAPREVMALHAELREKIRAFVEGPAGIVWRIPTDGLQTVLFRASAPGAKPAIFSLSHGGPLRAMLWQALARLVADTGQLIACPTCGEPFMALLKKKFCKPKCAERWHDRKKIEKKQAGVGR